MLLTETLEPKNNDLAAKYLGGSFRPLVPGNRQVPRDAILGFFWNFHGNAKALLQCLS